MSADKAKTNWFWPKIVDIDTAKAAAKNGYWAAIVVATVTALVATIALFSQKEIMSIDPWAYLDAALFALIAWRIKNYSKIFAIVGVVLFVIERAVMAASNGATGWPLAIVLMLMFINGARGVFGYHRFSAATSQVKDA